MAQAVTEAGLQSMAPIRGFTENTLKINHLHYSEDGRKLLASSDEDVMTLYDCVNGSIIRSVMSKKYGVNLAHFVRDTNDVIHASSKVDNTIRYLGLTKNEYVRYFIGHTKKVVTLRMSPTDEMFLSGAADNTIRLWDLRISSCQGVMNLTAPPIASFDPEGLIFGIGVSSDTVRLYDVRSFDKGPFASFTNKNGELGTTPWTDMAFSPDGKTILLMTTGKEHYLIDAFSGELQATLSGHENKNNSILRACFTPCSNYVVGGGTDGRLMIWHRDTGRVVQIFDADLPDPIEHCAFNPKFYVLATACNQLRLWTPTFD